MTVLRKRLQVFFTFLQVFRISFQDHHKPGDTIGAVDHRMVLENLLNSQPNLSAVWHCDAQRHDLMQWSLSGIRQGSHGH